MYKNILQYSNRGEGLWLSELACLVFLFITFPLAGLSVGVVDKIERIMRGFLWTGVDRKRRITSKLDMLFS